MSERCGAGTVGNALTVIRSFCRWCLLEDLRDDDPTLKVRWPRLRKPAPRALKRAELRRLLQALEEPENLPEHQRFTWARNRRTVMLMLYAGLRISEAAALRWRDVDLEAGELMVVDGKGGKDRLVPLHPVLQAELGGGGPARQPAHESKKPGHLFERWLPDCDLYISAHRLRHSFASELLRNGADLRAIQELMGHSSLETTQRYLMLASEQLRSAIDKLPEGW